MRLDRGEGATARKHRYAMARAGKRSREQSAYRACAHDGRANR
jgi:hypothetical protein